MSIQVLLFSTLMMAGQIALANTSLPGKNAQGVFSAASSQRIQDGVEQIRIAGIFQRYDASRRVVRISDVDYELDASSEKLGSKLGTIRSGQRVLFTQGGISSAGRNVLTSIEPQ